MVLLGEESLPIALELRLAFLGMECALGVTLSVNECKRAFSDAANDQVSEKEYVFFRSPHLTVTGSVDHYEPDTIRLQLYRSRRPLPLRLAPRRNDRSLLSDIAEKAKVHAQMLRRAEEFGSPS